ncbi:MAG: hypothetical protein IT532_13200 [Burkholderiales bacterium]|nr:hypothetical protein [Burkholderiales bacterium]
MPGEERHALPGSRAGLAAALIHLLLLGVTVVLILDSREDAWTGHWFVFLALDFPVSLGVIPVAWLVPPSPQGPLSDLSNFWWPLAYHAIVGTGWWYIVGWTIGRSLRPGTGES